MINKTYLPHTYENQAVLREYGAKISGSFGKQAHLMKGPSLWERIRSYLPGFQTVGYKAGEHLSLTYGAQWSNSVIDFVVGRFFKPEKSPPSFWDRFTDIFKGITEKTMAETLKLAITPVLLPYLTVMTGTAASVAAPTIVCLISLAYQKAMFDPRKLQQLSDLPTDKLFTVDEETGRLRDAFGRLMSPEDMKDIFAGAAKYDLICKLIELCHQVDLIDADDSALQEETYKRIETLTEAYMIECSDGRIMFPDGYFCTGEEKEILHKGMLDLSRINPRQKSKKIRKFVRLLANHSLRPFETLSPNEKIGLIGKPKRMPAHFSEEDQLWKNSIIRTEDGKYVITQDSKDRKKGTMIENEEMAQILNEMQAIQLQKAVEQQQDLYVLFKQPKKHKELIEKLNQLTREEIKAFFKSYVIQRADEQVVFRNGDLLSEKDWQKFQQDLALLPTKQDMNGRAEKIKSLIACVAAHLPKEEKLIDDLPIQCHDGVSIDLEGNIMAEVTTVNKIEKKEQETLVLV